MNAIHDVHGVLWRIDETRPTSHGWAVYLGHPLSADGDSHGRPGNTVIVTSELRGHLAATIARPRSVDLPLAPDARRAPA